MIKSIKNQVQTTIEIEKSKFICTLIPVNSIDSVLKLIAELSKTYADATHNCYAYTLNKGSIQKCSDDGEPSRTAGYPILLALQNNNLDNVLCVVTRYFGGVKLGAGGLVRAYTQATVEAINNSVIVNYYPSITMEITFDFNFINPIDNLLNTTKTEVLEKSFLDKVTYKINVSTNEITNLENSLINLTKDKILISNKQTSCIKETE